MHAWLVVSITIRGDYRTAGFDTREAAETYAGYRHGMPAIRHVAVLPLAAAVA